LATVSDEFYRSRVNVGTRFVMGGIGLYLFAAWLMNIFDLAHSAGYVLASGESAADTGLVGLFWTDALTLASVLSVLFYAGYTFAVIRETTRLNMGIDRSTPCQVR
jgi:membrane protein implicated in regulation of membrane protease activity